MTDTGYQGLLDPTSGTDEYNAMLFMVRQILSGVNTATLVKVISCTNAGGVAATGTVNVQPLINQQAANGDSIEHGTLSKLPYFRFQGGANGIILDPQPNDIGIAIFASRDISTVKTTKAQANPGSKRQFSMADGLYLGGVLNGIPTNYVQFTGSTLNIVASGTVNVNAPAINLSNGGATNKLVNELFEVLFNAHTHSSSGAGTPNTPMDSSMLTAVTKAQ